MVDLIARGDVLKEINKFDFCDDCKDEMREAINAIPSTERKVDREKLAEVVSTAYTGWLFRVICKDFTGEREAVGSYLSRKIAEAIEGDKC